MSDIDVLAAKYESDFHSYAYEPDEWDIINAIEVDDYRNEMNDDYSDGEPFADDWS